MGHSWRIDNGREDEGADGWGPTGGTDDRPAEARRDGDEAGAPPRALPLVLGVLGMILIPLGLIALYVAFTSGTDDSGQNAPPSTTPPATSALAVPSPLLVGRWNVLAGPDSWVGYTVSPIVPRVPAPSPVSGRTEGVTGGLVIDGNGTVVAVAVNIELDTLRSTDPGLDQQMQVAGLETDTYPYATFVLTTPIQLPPTVVTGQTAEVVAEGDLTLHGVTRAVRVPLQAELIPTDPYQITLNGKVGITLSDFDIPLGGSTDPVRFQDDAQITLHLTLTRVPDEVATAPVRTPAGSGVPATTGTGSSVGTSPR